MKRIAMVLGAAILAATPVMADEKATDEEAAKVKAILSAWGCEGGRIEKESEAGGVFEVDDAKCKDGGQYDFRISKDFKLKLIVTD
ncbi:MAG: hypothetical protein KDJ37_00210 [Hyphomicrobiaceae bacterium]|nr:hypothetical protein [Hyphomicrobiaceae bacterium]